MEKADTKARRGSAERTRAPLLGRDRELAELESSLEDALAGRGGAVLIAGESGIGKTRLAEALSDRAQAEGVLPLWGRCWESGGGSSFWPWVQALRRLVREREDDKLTEEIGGGAGLVGQIVPELRERLGDVPPATSLESEQARFALFDAVATFLRNAARARPLLILLEDLHSADQTSLLLFEFVAQAIADDSLLLVGTYQEAAARKRPEIEHLLGNVARDAKPLLLGGLDERDLAQLVEHRAEQPAPPELVSALLATTDGNPFFADELIRLMGSRGDLELWIEGNVRARFPLPDTVRETVRRHFETLGEPGIEVLQAAAVIGREFRFDTLERALGVARESLLELIDEAQASGLLIEQPGVLGGFRFSHGLIRDTLYSELSTAARVRLHRSVGEALEETYAASSDRLAELAHHFAEAAPAGDPQKAFEYAQRAGRHAIEVLAFEHAAELYELALRASELLEPDQERKAELVLAVGEARARADDERARPTLIEAAAAARGVDRADLLARATLGVRAFAFGPGVPDDVLLRMFDEALTQLGPAETPLRARLLARQAVALYYSPGSEERRNELAEKAVAMARGLDDPATLAYVLSNAQLATWGPDTTEQCLAWSEELLRITQQIGDAELALVARHRQIDFLLELDDLAGADIALEALARMAGESPEPRAQAYAALHRARRELTEGNFADAERLNAVAAAEGARLKDPTIPVLVAAQAFGLSWSQGRHAELEGAVRSYADGAPGMPAWRVGLALVYGELGREPQARREFDRLATDDFAAIPRDNDFLLNLALLTEVCAVLGDEERARSLYTLLEPYAGRQAVCPHAFILGPVTRYLGLLAATRGDLETAGRHFADAAATAAAANARPVLAQIRLDEARAVAEDEEPRARALIAEALNLADQMQADAIAEEARTLLERLDRDGGPAPEAPSAEPSAPASLRREGDVWTFAWAGRLVRVRDSKGVGYIATLLSNPGVEIHSTELVAGPGGRGNSPGASAELEGPSSDDVGPVLDAAAKASYRERLEELQEEIEEAESFNDPERASRAREELDAIGAELAGAIGLGGRDRKLGSTAERARVNVTRAIRGVVKRVEEHDRALGRELSTTLRTGTFCAYEPDPRRPVAWKVEDA